MIFGINQCLYLQLINPGYVTDDDEYMFNKLIELSDSMQKINNKNIHIKFELSGMQDMEI